MPYEYSIKLRNERGEKPDQHEMDVNHLKHAEQAYLELESIYHFERVNCVENDRIKTPKEISEEVYRKVKRLK
jgi:dTMP kinase